MLIDYLDSINTTLGGDLFIDHLLLFGQITVLGWMLISEIRSRRRNLLFIAISGATLVLVQGQAWWSFSVLAERGWLVHYGQAVSLNGARLANVYSALFVTAFVLTYLAARRSPRPVVVSSRIATEGSVARLIVWVWVLLCSALLVVTVGGLGSLVTEPGRLIPGQTVFLVGVGLAKLPLLRAIVMGEPPRSSVVWLFVFAFIVTLFNSRFLSLFMVLQAFVLFNYCRREVSRFAMLGVAIVTFMVIVVYGLYRDFANHIGGTLALGPQLLQEYQTSRISDGLISWFYMWNDEGFVGLAKILTYEQFGVPNTHDWGLSELSVFTHLLPNVIRNNPDLPFQGIAQTLESAYPYHGSIVPPGLEMAYAHFGLVGLILFGVLLGFLVARCHQLLGQPSADRLLVGLLSVELLLMVRGTFQNVVFFGLGDLALLVLYRAILALTSELNHDTWNTLRSNADPLRNDVEVRS